MKSDEVYDLVKGLNKSAELIYEGNKEKGFWEKDFNLGEKLMLVVSELGEALEASRKEKLTPDDAKIAIRQGHIMDAANFQVFVKDTVEDEIADSIIRLLDLCGGLGIDIEGHIRNKVNYNLTRPRLHGKSY